MYLKGYEIPRTRDNKNVFMAVRRVLLLLCSSNVRCFCVWHLARKEIGIKVVTWSFIAG